MAEDDDEGMFGSMYEDGHWVWDEAVQGLVFINDLHANSMDTIQVPLKAPTGTVEFRDDVDVIEQIRFRRRYQRKLKQGEADVITVQDVKDIALFTAPVNILSLTLVNMLHLATTERFIRALILYCQYYLQIADVMAHRMLELETKIRTPMCEMLENEFRENLADLRVVVAKEYCTMLLGGADTKKYHHMGPLKKRQSLSDKDARLIETLLRMCVQITWLALGRKSFNQIELEVNRLFKSEIFNGVEHTLHTGYIGKMTKEEKSVLLGHCVRHDKKLNTRSPLGNEVFCHRPIDYRMMGLGVVKCPQLSSRLLYMQLAVAGPQEELLNLGITVGILGMPRSKFDTMLHPLSLSDPTSKSRYSMGSDTTNNVKISASKDLKRRSLAGHIPTDIYPDIEIPPKDKKEIYLPPTFPDDPDQVRPCSETQRIRWLTRFTRLLSNSK